jgi:acetyl-CoA synthetase
LEGEIRARPGKRTAKPAEPSHKTQSHDPAYLVYTSGTTGYPKGVLHAHRAMVGREPAAQYWFDFAEDGHDRIVHSGKFNWTYVLGSGLMDPLYRGKTVIVHEGKNDAAGWIRLIAKHSATIFIGVPTIYRQIIQKTQFTGADVPTLRHCMSAGEHLSDEMLGLWKDRFGVEIYEAVGMSEVSYYLSENKFRPIRPGSAGFPQPGHDVRLLDPETLREVEAGEEGMICLPADDPGLFMRYWNLPEETGKAFKERWFLTGDYARFDDDGYIWFLGRRDDIINSFGYRVSPHEIERVMKTHPAVADCAATGEELAADKVLVVAYVMLHPGSSVTADELAAFGREHLAGYKAPKIVYLAADFPRTKNGKIIRKQLSPGRSLATVLPGGRHESLPSASFHALHPGLRAALPGQGSRIAVDTLIFDLEESVLVERKTEARRNAAEALQQGGYGQREVVVRVNRHDPPGAWMT